MRKYHIPFSCNIVLMSRCATPCRLFGFSYADFHSRMARCPFFIIIKLAPQETGQGIGGCRCRRLFLPSFHFLAHLIFVKPCCPAHGQSPSPSPSVVESFFSLLTVLFEKRLVVLPHSRSAIEDGTAGRRHAGLLQGRAGGWSYATLLQPCLLALLKWGIFFQPWL